jgi:mRNA interferase RelE/StbE
MALTWKVNIPDSVRKDLKKLGVPAEKEILRYLKKIELSQSPKSSGRPLVGDMRGLWRYRVGDYRIICRIQENELIVLVLEIGHRSEIYK